jgi:hypothetical protein
MYLLRVNRVLERRVGGLVRLPRDRKIYNESGKGTQKFTPSAVCCAELTLESFDWER